VVKIFAFLDLKQISADFEIEHFETGSSDYIFLSSRSEYRFCVAFAGLFTTTIRAGAIK
jgi:hypothetical protein